MGTRRSLLGLVLLAAPFAAPVGCEHPATETRVPGDAAESVISLRDIDCQSCGVRVVEALRAHEGVYAASFDRASAELSVRYDATRTGPADFLALVQQQGYTGVEGAGHGAYVPEVEFDPGLDVQKISHAGEAVGIRDHLVADKVTVFDFYAVWCKPCREVDHHMKKVLAAHPDVALRKLDVVDWDSEIAAEYLRGVPDLPYVVVFGKDGERVAAISGLHLDRLDDAIAKGRVR